MEMVIKSTSSTKYRTDIITFVCKDMKGRICIQTSRIGVNQSLRVKGVFPLVNPPN